MLESNKEEDLINIYDLFCRFEELLGQLANGLLEYFNQKAEGAWI